jgi:hypothetical protein
MNYKAHFYNCLNNLFVDNNSLTLVYQICVNIEEILLLADLFLLFILAKQKVSIMIISIFTVIHHNFS